MIDFNDRFVGLMIGLSMVMAFALYLILFTKPEEEKRSKKAKT